MGDSAPPLDALPRTACAAQATLSAYLGSLSVAAREADFGVLQEDLLTLSLGATTLIAAGAALVLGPALIGRDWLTKALTLGAGLVGAVGGDAVLSSGLGASGFGQVVALLGLSAEAGCLAHLAVVLASALYLGSAAARTVSLAIFVLGAAAAGYGAWLASAALEHTDAAPTPQQLQLGVAACALLGGLVFSRVAAALLDGALALFGSVLVAQGLLQLAAPRLVGGQKASIEEYHLYLAAALAGCTLYARHLVFGRRAGNERAKDEGLVMR